MLGHKFLNPGLVLYIFHVSVGICFVYNVLYFLRFFIAYMYFFATASQDCGAIVKITLYVQFI